MVLHEELLDKLQMIGVRGDFYYHYFYPIMRPILNLVGILVYDLVVDPINNSQQP